jgi:hypothetical protein
MVKRLVGFLGPEPYIQTTLLFICMIQMVLFYFAAWPGLKSYVSKGESIWWEVTILNVEEWTFLLPDNWVFFTHGLVNGYCQYINSRLDPVHELTTSYREFLVLLFLCQVAVTMIWRWFCRTCVIALDVESCWNYSEFAMEVELLKLVRVRPNVGLLKIFRVSNGCGIAEISQG